LNPSLSSHPRFFFLVVTGVVPNIPIPWLEDGIPETSVEPSFEGSRGLKERQESPPSTVSRFGGSDPGRKGGTVVFFCISEKVEWTGSGVDVMDAAVSFATGIT